MPAFLNLGKMSTTQKLRQTLRPVHLWAIGVGLVISGEYFGWNYGWGVAGTVGFLIATLIVTLLYVCFVFSFTELTTAIPHAGGAFAYSYRAMGPLAGLVAGYATLIDFLLATPAIAIALGSYLHFLYPQIPIAPAALVFNLFFVLLNISGIRESAAFSLFVTILAVAELLLFIGIVSPHFKSSNFLRDPMPFGVSGIFAALPFAIWFYLAIEGMAMMAEELKDPSKNIPRGYILALLTLVFLALAVMIFSGGIADWHALSNIDYPLPEAIATALGRSSAFTKIFASIGLFGLLASMHGTLMSSSRQVFAMARSGFLPRTLSVVSNRYKTPHWAIIAAGLVSSVAIISGTTAQVIMLSVLGAVCMYIMSMLSLFVLRRKEPELLRPFKSPAYPVFPLIALLLSVLCLVAIMVYNFWISMLFFAGLLVTIVVYLIFGSKRIPIDEPMLSPVIPIE